MNIAITDGIKVSVVWRYRPNHSFPSKGMFIYSYHVIIENNSPSTVQLLRRHWYITDSNGTVREVEGEGVIGEQPIIQPGEIHEYESACDLRTDIGSMKGTYLMMKIHEKKTFEVTIPEFILSAPFKMN